MNPVATEDPVPAIAPSSHWHALGDLAVSVVVVSAIALIVSFIAAA